MTRTRALQDGCTAHRAGPRSPRRGFVGGALIVVLALLAGCVPARPPLGTPSHAGAVPQQAGCRVTLRADLPTRMVGGSVLFDGRINGRSVAIAADTGTTAPAVLHVEPARAAELGLDLVDSEASVSTLGGELPVDVSVSNRIAAGGAARDGLPILVPDAGRPADFIPGDGVLGMGFLAYFDLEFDPYAGRVRFFEVDGCGGQLVPFAEPFTTIPMRPGPSTTPMIPVRLNGVEMMAAIDTGAEGSLITREGARLAGVSDAALSGDEVISGAVCDAQGTLLDICIHQFKSFEINEVRRVDVALPVLLAEQGAPAYIGRDVLMGQRILISFATSKLYVSRIPAR